MNDVARSAGYREAGVPSDVYARTEATLTPSHVDSKGKLQVVLLAVSV